MSVKYEGKELPRAYDDMVFNSISIGVSKRLRSEWYNYICPMIR